MIDFVAWLQNVMERGLSFAIRRYYSIYRGVVTDNKDPLKRGRIKVICPQVGQTEAPAKWVLPAMAGSGLARGTFFAPEVGDTVWVSFYEGDGSMPEVYWGGWYGAAESDSDVPVELQSKTDFPDRKGWVTRAGHSITFDDTDGAEQIVIKWNKPADDDPAKKDRTKTAKHNPKNNAVLSIDKTGSFMMKTPGSYMFQMDDQKGTVTVISPKGSMFHIAADDSINLIHKSGSSIAMSDSAIDLSGNTAKQMNVNISGQNVNINGGGVLLGGKAIDFAVLGLKLIKWLALHVHGTALGPSTPPLVPPTPADFCSKTVKVQD